MIPLAVTFAAEEGADSGFLLPIILGVLVLVGTLATGWFTYRLGSKTAQETRETEDQKLTTANWVAQIENWRQDVVTLRQQRAEDLAAHEEHRRTCTAQITALTQRVDGLVGQQAEDRRQRRILEERNDALVYWGLQVIRIMREKDVAFPPPPASIVELDRQSPPLEDGTW